MLLIVSNQAKLSLSKIEKYTYDVWWKDQSLAYILSFNQKFDSTATIPRHGRFLFVKNGVECRKITHKEHIIFYKITIESIMIYKIKS